MGLAMEGDDINVCKACIRDANSLKDPALFFFSEGNKLNPGPVIGFLPILTVVEELLIVCVYVYLQIVCVCGQ